MGLQDIDTEITRTFWAIEAAAEDPVEADRLAGHEADLLDAMIATASESHADLLRKILHLAWRVRRDQPYCVEEAGDDLILSIAEDAKALLIKESV